MHTLIQMHAQPYTNTATRWHRAWAHLHPLQAHTHNNQTCKQTRVERVAAALPLCISLPHPLYTLPLDTTQTLPVGQHWESGEDVHGSHTSPSTASLKAVACVNLWESVCAFGAFVLQPQVVFHNVFLLLEMCSSPFKKQVNTLLLLYDVVWNMCDDAGIAVCEVSKK